MSSTISDVAAKAGVSVATVSRVLNNSNLVKDSTRIKVQAAIKELDYEPNLLGKNLRQAYSGRILVLIPMLSGTFFEEVCAGIQDYAHRKGYKFLLAQTYYEGGQVTGYVDMIRNRFVDGLILLDQSLNQDMVMELAQKYPVVNCMDNGPDTNISTVSIDDAAATKMAVQHLLSIGKRNIGMINYDLRYRFAIIREQAMRETLAQNGLNLERKYVRYLETWHYDNSLAAATDLLRQKDRPDALFCSTDNMAVGAVRAAQNLGLSIPKDVAMVGFDDLEIAAMCKPMITSVNQPRFEMGSEACRLLVERIENKDAPVQKLVLRTQLMVRESTLG